MINKQFVVLLEGVQESFQNVPSFFLFLLFYIRHLVLLAYYCMLLYTIRIIILIYFYRITQKYIKFVDINIVLYILILVF